MSAERSLWPDVTTDAGRAFAFRLAAAGAVGLTLAALCVVVAGLWDRLAVFHYAADLPRVVVIAVAAVMGVLAAVTAWGLRREQRVAAWGFLVLLLGGFVADAWYGVGAWDWLVIALSIFAIQGVRAARSLR